jgi:hypothetical protein
MLRKASEGRVLYSATMVSTPSSICTASASATMSFRAFAWLSFMATISFGITTKRSG